MYLYLSLAITGRKKSCISEGAVSNLNLDLYQWIPWLVGSEFCQPDCVPGVAAFSFRLSTREFGDRHSETLVQTGEYQ